MQPIDKVLERLKDPRPSGDGWRARCPVHGGESPDSLSVGEGDDGTVLLHCFAGCGVATVVESLGLYMSDLYPPTPELKRFQSQQLSAMRQPTARTAQLLKAADRAVAASRVVELDLAEPRPELPDLDEFLGLEFAPRVPLLGPIKSGHVVHASGASGAGKTQLAVALSIAIGTCTDWCHWKAHEQRIVLHVDGELPPGELQDRFRAQHVSGARVVPLSAIWLAEQGVDHLNIATPGHQALIEHYIERYGATVLNLDNVMSLVFIEGVSMSSDEFWRPVSAWLRRLRGKGITSIVWDHTNAAGLTFGTKTKEWQSDLAMQLTVPEGKEPEDGCRFELRFGKTRGLHGPEVRPVRVELLDDAAGTKGVSSAQIGTAGASGRWRTDFIVDERRQDAREMRVSGKSVRAIAAALGVPRSTVSDWTRGS